MSHKSRIEALRNLAERPGTEHEGAVAREMLRKLQEKSAADPESESITFAAYPAYLRRDISIDAFLEALANLREWNCPCGSRSIQGKCGNWQKHLEIQAEIRSRFKKGDRVLYNYRAYPADCPGKVAAYVPLRPDSGDGTYPWCWLSIKFDQYKSARQVPIYSCDGWHLKHATIEQVEI